MTHRFNIYILLLLSVLFLSCDKLGFDDDKMLNYYKSQLSGENSNFPDSIVFTNEGGEKLITLNNGIKNITFSGVASWLECEWTTAGIKFTTQTNTDSKRDCDVTINLEYAQHTDEKNIHIIQEGDFKYLSQEEIKLPNGSGEMELKLKKDVEFTVNKTYNYSSSWLTVTKTEKGFKLEYEPNYGEDRFCTLEVKIKTGVYASHTENLTVSQEGGYTLLTEKEITLPNSGGESKEIRLTVKEDYKITNGASWLTVIETNEGFKVKAIPNVGKARQENIIVTITSTSSRPTMTLTINQDGDYSYNYEYIDLGLPSGTLWATQNLGVETETGENSYYSFGGQSGSYHPWKYDGQNEMRNNGYIDDNYNLVSDYDMATQTWGYNWCLPTKEQFEELVSNCTIVSANLDGVDGYKISKNGKSIFFPLRGYKSYPSAYSITHTNNYYATSSTVKSGSYVNWVAYDLTNTGFVQENITLEKAISIRPVRKKATRQ